MDQSYKNLSAVYDALMYDVDYDAWAAYLTKLLLRFGRENARILEASCGTGNLSFRLKKRGFDITATDLSEEMIAVAEQKATENGVRIPFARQDMRTLESAPKHAVLSCCDGVNYLTDDDALRGFFSSAFSCMKRKGVLMFDISSKNKLSTVIGDNLFYEDGEDITYFWKNSYDPAAETVRMELTLFLREEDRYLRYDEEHLQKAHDPEHLKDLLTECGYREVYAYSFLTENDYTDSDERIQFIALKY